MAIRQMSSARRYRLGDLQLRIMRALWQRGPCGVADVQAAVGPTDLAYTTIATMLRKMEARGLVRHRSDGRRFLYRAAVAPDAVSRSMTSNLLENLFAGSLADLLSHLLTTRDVSPQELARLEHLIAERKKQK